MVTGPCILVEKEANSSYYTDALEFLSRQGYEIKVGENIEKILPLDFSLGRLDNRFAEFYCKIVFSTVPANVPKNLWLREDNEVFLVVKNEKASYFREKVQALSDWLGLDWKLPEIPVPEG